VLLVGLMLLRIDVNFLFVLFLHVSKAMMDEFPKRFFAEFSG